jgi:hypothetical protein
MTSYKPGQADVSRPTILVSQISQGGPISAGRIRFLNLTARERIDTARCSGAEIAAAQYRERVNRPAASAD